ncbi:MAG TPA: c-type cytochrome [Candidatus Angelobacter sp.]|nr:c-type cytochrome [Candidatus Angelobacter sp.]
MKFFRLVLCVLSLLLFAGCAHRTTSNQLTPKNYGAQIVEVSGSKQVAQVGDELPQAVVVQVNGADGNAVSGALVSFRGDGLTFNPQQALADASGQVTTTVQVGFVSGNYTVTAETPKQGGGTATADLGEIALGYESTLGKAVNEKHCIRCHDAESTLERVSNLDNLSPAPHQFSDGATYNLLSDAYLANIINHGGQGVDKSPQMPAYGATLKPAEIKAVIAYIRGMADPPYTTSGVKHEK